MSEQFTVGPWKMRNGRAAVIEKVSASAIYGKLRHDGIWHPNQNWNLNGKFFLNDNRDSEMDLISRIGENCKCNVGDDGGFNMCFACKVKSGEWKCSKCGSENSDSCEDDLCFYCKPKAVDSGMTATAAPYKKILPSAEDVTVIPEKKPELILGDYVEVVNMPGWKSHEGERGYIRRVRHLYDSEDMVDLVFLDGPYRHTIIIVYTKYLKLIERRGIVPDWLPSSLVTHHWKQPEPLLWPSVKQDPPPVKIPCACCDAFMRHSQKVLKNTIWSCPECSNGVRPRCLRA